MTIINVPLEDQKKFNRLALHPLQSWKWGEFRKKTGLKVIRLGKYEGEKLVETAQITIHPLLFLKYTIGYFPKGSIPSKEMLNNLIDIGKKYHCIFIKLEPNVKKENSPHSSLLTPHSSLFPSPHPLFTKYTFQLDLTKTEEELLKAMHHKTRYNIKVAQKHGVKVEVDNSDKAFEEYLRLTFETTKRQKFYAHNKQYHQLMWETLKNQKLVPSKVEGSKKNKLTAHLLTATYQEDGESYILATWIVFLFNNILYYPYGASSNKFRNTMASNLIMWEAIRFGKKKGAKLFDMWGSLEPNPDPKDPWFGFHRFKKGYGGKLVEFVGSYDLVINPGLYRLYNIAYKIRQMFLRIK